MGRRPCSMSTYGCKYTVADNSPHTECYLCRSRVSFWAKKEPSDVMRRNEQLRKLLARNELVTEKTQESKPRTKTTKVHVLHRRHSKAIRPRRSRHSEQRLTA